MMKKIAAFIKGVDGPLLSGVLIGTSYIPFPPWAALFAYAPLWLWLLKNSASGKRAFLGGWITQFVLSLIGFHWIAHTAHEFGDFPWVLAILTLALFAAFIHLYIPLAALVSQACRRRFGLGDAPFFFVCAIVFSLVERVWPSIFPWHLGYALLWARWPVYQWADTIGFAGLSTLVFFANAWIAILWRKSKAGEPILKQATALVAIIVALTLGGLWKKQQWTETDSTLNALAVQANVGNLEKVYAEQGRGFREAITLKFIDLTRQGLVKFPQTDLVVWPETALPDAPDRPEFSRGRLDIISSSLASYGKPMLIGAYSKDAAAIPPAKEALTYNALFLLGPHAEVLSAPYRKTYLLAFGEYLPFSDQFPVLLEWLPFISNFGRGQGPQVLSFKSPGGSVVPIGGQICYEGLFPNFTRGLSEQGAEILFNVTNDSWFGTPFEPRQHMMMTLARAIESRRPLVRVTNTGITTAILASGEQLERSPTHEEWVGNFEVRYRKNPAQTFYVLYGHWDWLGLIAVLFVLLLRGPGRARTPEEKPHDGIAST